MAEKNKWTTTLPFEDENLNEENIAEEINDGMK